MSRGSPPRMKIARLFSAESPMRVDLTTTHENDYFQRSIRGGLRPGLPPFKIYSEQRQTSLGRARTCEIACPQHGQSRVKIPYHKTPYRCPHRLNLSSQSSRSCAGPNIKLLKDKDLEFANSNGSFFATVPCSHKTHVRTSLLGY